jgi:hypothetical protein
MWFAKLILVIALAVLSAFGGGPRPAVSRSKAGAIRKSDHASQGRAPQESCERSAAEITYGPYGPCGEDLLNLPPARER